MLRRNLIAKHERKVVALLLLLPLLVGMGIVLTPVSAASPLPSKMELSLSGFTFTPYTSYYKTSDALINDRVVDIGFILGLNLLKEDTQLDLSGSTFESDDLALTPTVKLSDRPAYSFTFLNETVDAGVASAGTINTEFAIGNRGTQGSGTWTSNTTPPSNVVWATELAFDENNDGDYVDSGDKAYLPLSGQEFFYVGFSVDFPATVDAGTYGEVNLYFVRTSGTNYVVHLRAYPAAGDTGWTSVGGSADNQAIFAAYDADAAFIGITVPLEDLYAADSSETGSIIGLDKIEYKLYRFLPF